MLLTLAHQALDLTLHREVRVDLASVGAKTYFSTNWSRFADSDAGRRFWGGFSAAGQAGEVAVEVGVGPQSVTDRILLLRLNRALGPRGPVRHRLCGPRVRRTSVGIGDLGSHVITQEPVHTGRSLTTLASVAADPAQVSGLQLAHCLSDQQQQTAPIIHVIAVADRDVVALSQRVTNVLS